MPLTSIPVVLDDSGEPGRELLLDPPAAAADKDEEEDLELPKKFSLCLSTRAMSAGGEEDCGGAFLLHDSACCDDELPTWLDVSRLLANAELTFGDEIAVGVKGAAAATSCGFNRGRPVED